MIKVESCDTCCSVALCTAKDLSSVQEVFFCPLYHILFPPSYYNVGLKRQIVRTSSEGTVLCDRNKYPPGNDPSCSCLPGRLCVPPRSHWACARQDSTMEIHLSLRQVSWFTGSIQKLRNNVNTLKEKIVFVFLVRRSVKLHLNINKVSRTLTSWRTVWVCERFSYLCFCVWAVSVFRPQSRPQHRINPCLNRCDQCGFSASLCHSSSPIFSVLPPPLPLLQVLSLTNTHFFLCYGLAGAHRANKQMQASSAGAGMDPHC